MNIIQLIDQLQSKLKNHDYLTFCPMTKGCAKVKDEEIYSALLNPATSSYFNTPHSDKTLLQSNGHLLTMMFYAYYCGYLYASIRDNEQYDKNIWTYEYMHSKLNGQIYEPIFISLIPQILNYEISSNLKDLYHPISVKIFSIVLRFINGYISTYKVDNFNIFGYNKYDSDFYKSQLPDWLAQLHREGTFLFFDAKYQHSRLEGKNIISKNLLCNLNNIQY